MAHSKPILALTAGDINGIGYEVMLKALLSGHITEICTPVIYGNLAIAKQHYQTFLSEDTPHLNINTINNVENAVEGKINLLGCYPDNTPLTIGQATPEAGKAAYASLAKACADLKAKKADALVTAPINKATIQSTEFPYPGHTEYLSAQFRVGQETLMMLVNEQMRVALVCNHTPLKDIPSQITQDHILNKLDILNQSLKQDFNIQRPRIAVLALNPHAGDNGLLGKEEKDIIKPAIDKANQSGKYIYGPFPADGFFGNRVYQQFDGVLAMYHDQGLIPFKSLDMSGVNFTAGLSIIRTSPDHGTAFDIAGKNQADATSFLHAMYMAIDLYNKKQN